jgi:hypothetical protein
VFTTLRRVAAVAAATTIVIGLAACSSTGSPAAERPTDGAANPTPSASATAAPGSGDDPADETISFGRSPDTAGWPGCAQLLPTDLVDAVVPGVAVEDPLTAQAHTTGAWAFPRAAGGTSCWATNGVSSLDDVAEARHDDPVYQGVHVSVLPDARPEFEAAGGNSPESAGMSMIEVRCDATDAARVQCQGGVLAGDAWVDLAIIRAQDSADATPEVVLPAFRALLGRVQQTVASSAGASVSTDHEAASNRLTVCDSDRVDAVSDVDLSTWQDVPTDVAVELRDFAMNRVDAASCDFQYDGAGRYAHTGAVYSALPDGGWVLEQRLGNGVVDRSGRVDLDGLEAGDGAWRTCDDTLCSVDVLRDGTWEHFALWRAVAPNTASAIVRWAEASLAA